MSKSLRKRLVRPYQGKISVAFIKVISFFLEHSGEEFSGYDIFKKTNLQSGTVYPMLSGLVENGWLESEWEIRNPKPGKPARLLYKLTGGGYHQAIQLLSEHISKNIDKCFDQPPELC